MVEPVLAPMPMTLEVEPLGEAKMAAAIREETEKEVLEGETAEEKAEREKDETLHRGWSKVMSDPSLHPAARRVVGEYRDIFCNEIPKLPPRRSVEFTIDLEPGHPPPARPPYRLSFGELDEMRRLAIPTKTLQRQVIWECHDSPLAGHLGVDKTYRRLAADFFWPHM